MSLAADLSSAFSHPFWLLAFAIFGFLCYLIGHMHGYDICEDDMRDEEAQRVMQRLHEETNKWHP